MNQTCQTCRYLDPQVGDDGSLFSKCRRFPPLVIDDGDGPAIVFPQVDGDDWCGEWKGQP